MINKYINIIYGRYYINLRLDKRFEKMVNKFNFRICIFALVIAISLFSTSDLYANNPDMFKIENVIVDIEAENAVIAKEKAIVKARKESFRKLAKKILNDTDFSNLKIPNDLTIGSMIRDFEITDEQASTTRYIGSMDFRYYPESVNSYFGQKKVKTVSETSKPVLVLPFFQTDRGTTLWLDYNPWRDAWKNNRSRDGLVQVYLPIGDLSDINDAPEDKLIGGDFESVEKLMNKYHVNDVVYFVANSTGQKGIKIFVYEFVSGRMEHTNTLNVNASTGPINGLYAQAVETAMGFLQDRWKREATGKSSRNLRTEISISFRTMRQWIDIQKKLRKVANISSQNIMSLDNDSARITIDYQGTESGLRSDLADLGLILGDRAESIKGSDGVKRLFYYLRLSR